MISGTEIFNKGHGATEKTDFMGSLSNPKQKGLPTHIGPKVIIVLKKIFRSMKWRNIVITLSCRSSVNQIMYAYELMKSFEIKKFLVTYNLNLFTNWLSF